MIEIVTEFERLRIIAPELLADAVGQPVTFLLQVLGHAGPLAQLDHDRVFDCKPAKAMPVGSQRVAEHVGVPAVVFGAGDGEAIAEAVELFRVDRIDLEVRSSRISTIGPCGTSIATAILGGSSPLVVTSQSHISARPAPPCAKALSSIILPSAATRQT
jgi:hypothetical protein